MNYPTPQQRTNHRGVKSYIQGIDNPDAQKYFQYISVKDTSMTSFIIFFYILILLLFQ